MQKCKSLLVCFDGPSSFHWLRSEWPGTFTKYRTLEPLSMLNTRCLRITKITSCKVITACTYHHPALSGFNAAAVTLPSTCSAEIWGPMPLKNVSPSCVRRWSLPWDPNSYNSWEQLEPPPVNVCFLYRHTLQIVCFKPLKRRSKLHKQESR